MKTEPQTVRNETAEQKQERLKQEHEWRQILQQQFAELWLRLNLPEQSHEKPQRKELKLEKSAAAVARLPKRRRDNVPQSDGM